KIRAGFLEDHNLRIYTEFNVGTLRADIAIVEINRKIHGYLRNNTKNIIAIIEFKYLNKNGIW
ncbi:MAG: hypothetical protein LBH54_01770, partial [Clostridiales bacterium]|nr:hypothetical protein [Clostridiales bacterium]